VKRGRRAGSTRAGYGCGRGILPQTQGRDHEAAEHKEQRDAGRPLEYWPPALISRACVATNRIATARTPSSAGKRSCPGNRRGRRAQVMHGFPWLSY
jgi:hypothetical protein